jgi:hypothetical protein
LRFLLHSHEPSQDIISCLGFVSCRGATLLLSKTWRERAQQGARSIPKNLHTNADEEKGGKPQDDAHPAFPYDRRELMSEAVAKVNAHSHKRRTNCGGENRK